MTGLCCRHQVRHGDDLCCRHGVICHGELAGPDEELWPVTDVGSHARGCAQCVPSREAGLGSLLLVVGVAGVFGVVALCAWLGYNASDWVKVLAAAVLTMLVLPMLGWLLDDPSEIDERSTFRGWRGTPRDEDVR